MADLKDLPPAELEVMTVLWDKGQATAKEVQEALGKKRKLAYTTVATLLSRLREKGYVSAEVTNQAYVFRPLVGKDQVAHRKLDDLVDRLFGGDLSPLAAYIAANQDLTPEQIAALEEIVKSDREERG